jgi:hypothetical protein
MTTDRTAGGQHPVVGHGGTIARRPPAVCDIVVPTIGRASLRSLLEALSRQFDAAPDGSRPARVIVVDDRARPDGPLLGPTAPDGAEAGRSRASVDVVRSGGRGPAAARNLGWRSSNAEWVAFLDDDVIPADRWWTTLLSDLGRAGPQIGGVQGRVVVPSPQGRRPTDQERNVGGLADARWATADMAYRRTALESVGGFDERFARAYREDADLALRTRSAGFGLVVGDRFVVHPVGPARWTASVARQRGNGDDALMRRLHGPHWRARAAAPPGAYPGHLVATLGLGAAVLGASARRHRLAALGALVWGATTARFAWRRIVAGPRTASEVAAMAATSVAIPLAAVWHRALGAWHWRSATRWEGASSDRLWPPDDAGVSIVPRPTSVAGPAGTDRCGTARPATTLAAGTASPKGSAVAR